jgi:hypothetical protein
VCHLYHEPDHAWFQMVEDSGKIVPKVYEE